MDYIVEQLNVLLEGQPLLALPFAYVGGVLTSFTPCVYPMIPIIVGVIGARDSRSKAHAFLLSLSYVLGLSLVYSTLGLFSALTGSLFGQISTSPWVNLALANVLLLFALSMFGFFEIKVPAFLLPKAGEKKGFIPAFVIGMTSGFVAAPCTAPVLGTLLVYVGGTQNAVMGILLMFSFALGMSTLLLIIGTFTGMVTALPKSSTWLERVKFILAFIMVFVAEYFIYRAGQFTSF
ncbi:MAG: sulfite exporter TauE/SafE family protein [Candidatus Omnitrophica bacterium]|nr:sulfite exporter TauE/SafE family protein [Candidatus Omnitrophota bacterium]